MTDSAAPTVVVLLPLRVPGHPAGEVLWNGTALLPLTSATLARLSALRTLIGDASGGGAQFLAASLLPGVCLIEAVDDAPVTAADLVSLPGVTLSLEPCDIEDELAGAGVALLCHAPAETVFASLDPQPFGAGSAAGILCSAEGIRFSCRNSGSMLWTWRELLAPDVIGGDVPASTR